MKLKSSTLNTIIERQRAWAGRAGHPIAASLRTPTLDANLFQPLRPDTRDEFERGAGSELAGDLRSLRSSAALVCNVFDYWRGRGLGAIATACGADPAASQVSFERTFPTGLRGTPPHLDAVLEGEGSFPTAIESKFTETLEEAHNEFRDSYFENESIWEGLKNSLPLACEIKDGRTVFERLGVAQLLKHALGLTRAYGRAGFRLLYLWYEEPSAEAIQLRRELDQFALRTKPDFEFAALTYQELFARLAPIESEHPAYIGYLRDRYFR